MSFTTQQVGSYRFEAVITGLKPNTVHTVTFEDPQQIYYTNPSASYFGTPYTELHSPNTNTDLGSQCQPIVPGVNYDAAFQGAKAAYPTKDANYWHKMVLFKGWNKNTSGTKLSNVITTGTKGGTLTTNANGLVAFVLYYIPEFGYSIADTTFWNTWSAARFRKDMWIKSADGTSKCEFYVQRETQLGRDLVYNRSYVQGENNLFVIPQPMVVTNTPNTVSNNVTSGTVFEIAQTWFVDPDLVGNVDSVYITKAELYFKSKPTPTTGITEPGVTVYLTPTLNRVPSFSNLNQYPSARMEYADIVTSNNATAATTFSFPTQGKVETGKEYAFVIKFDGRAPFVLWKCKQGDPLVGSATATSGATGNYIGLYYEHTSDITNWRALHDTDLKFKVYSAKYTGAPSISFVADEYEFVDFKETTSDPRFTIGERAFQIGANQTGTVSVSNTSTTVVGTSTLFQSLWSTGSADPGYIVMQSGNTYCVREVISVASNTSLTLDQPPAFTNTTATFIRSPVARVAAVRNSYLDGGKARMLVLRDSTANSTVYFQNVYTIQGELSNKYAANVTLSELKINRVAPTINLDVTGPASYTVNGTFYYKWNGTSGTLASTPLTRDLMGGAINITKEEALIFPSRSYEFSYGGLVNRTDDSKLSQINIAFSNVSSFAAPRINGNALLRGFRYVINNDYTNENTKYGNAYSKHVTTKVNLKENTTAEDMLVYLTAYRPANTDLKVFCKLYNDADSDAFDDKDWTLMELANTSNTLYSATPSDLVELTYGLPLYPNTSVTVSGTVTTTLNQANVIGAGTNFNTQLTAGDVVKVYSGLFENNYVLGVVNAVTNATHFSLKTAVANASVTGTGFLVDKIAYPYQAFRNITNDNVVRYYNSSKIEIDTYNTFAIKIVLLSDNDFIVPKVKNVGATAVTA